MSEINLTPLMDLTFILLITFIITFPLIEHGIAINVPKGKATPVEASDAQTISVDAEGEVYLNDTETSLDDLSVSMRRAAATDPTMTVFIRADEGIRYGRVVEVLKILHDAKISRTALVTRAE